ncbi:MAG: protease modulator HflC [Alphaproteobacteria bacterium]
MSGRAKLLTAGGVLLVALILLLASTFKVKEQEQAILLQFGDPRTVVTEPGLYFKTPFVQNVEYFDKRVLEFDGAAEEVILGDQKRLVVDAFLRYRITNALQFFQSLGTEEVARTRLSAILNGSLRQVLGKVPLITVLSGERASLMRDIQQQVNSATRGFGIDVIDVRIRRADLPEENSQAIYRRMQTEREREAREFRAQGEQEAQVIRSRAERERTVLLAEARRDAEITRGDGDGEAARIFAEAFQRDPEFFAFFRSLQAYRQALRSGDTTFVLSPDSEFFQYFEEAGDRTSRPAPRD